MPQRKLVQKTTGWEHWCTPEPFLERVRRIAPIGLDPCSCPASRTRAELEIWLNGTREQKSWATVEEARHVQIDDGLAFDWAGHGLVYVNPPYGTEIQLWALCLEARAGEGVEIVALLPSRTDARWWHNLTDCAQAGCFVKGRVQFDNPPPGSDGGGSNVPSFVGYWGHRPERFLEAFGDYGLCVRLRPPRAR